MKSQEQEIKDWEEQRDRGLEFRRRFGIEDSWSMLEALVSNVHQSQANSSANILSSNRESLLSAMRVPDPHISAVARRPDCLAAAPVIEAVDNMLVKEMKVMEEFEAACDYAYQFGVGFLKIGYDTEFGYDPEQDAGIPLGKSLGMTLSQFNQKTGERIEFWDTRPGMPWVKACLPHDIVVPYGTWKLDSTEWVMHRVIRHIDDLRADAKYQNTKNLQPNVSMEDFMRAYNSTMKPYRLGPQWGFAGLDIKKPEFVELWEIHDRRSGNIKVFATGSQKWLRNETNALAVEGLPFVEIKWSPSTRSLWTTPDAYFLLAHQLELTDITHQRTKRRRIDVLKGVINESMFDNNELQRLTSSRIGGIIRCNGNPAEAIAWSQPPGNNNLAMEEQATKQNAAETVGLSENQRGQFAGARTTAFEVAQVSKAVSTKLSRRQIIASEALETVFVKVNAIITKYWKTPQVIQVLDQMGQATWMQYTGTALRGEYQLDITFDEGGADSRTNQRQVAMQLYPILQQDPTVDQVKLRQWFARAINDVGVSSVFKDGILSGAVNANVLIQMQKMQDQGGGSSANGQGSAGGQVPGPGVQQGGGPPGVPSPGGGGG